MRSPLLPILLFLFVAIANSKAQKTVTIPPSLESAASQKTAELNHKTSEINKTIQNSAPDVHEKLKAIQAPSSSVVPVTVGIVQTERRQRLADEVQLFAAYLEHEERKYATLSAVLIFFSAGLALAGSIASFLAKNKMAGIISLIVAALVGLSNAYPVRPLANFYRDLRSQANLIHADCEFADPYTDTVYSANVAQYELLILAERQRPSLGSDDNQAPAITEQIKTVSIAAKNADTTKAAAQEIVGLANRPNQ